MTQQKGLSFEWFKERFNKIERIIKTTGEIGAVARHFKINRNTLLICRKKYPLLEAVVQDALKSREANKFNRDICRKIERIVQTGYIKDVYKYLGVSDRTLLDYRNQYPELKKSIEKGLQSRVKFKTIKTIPLDFIEYHLPQIEQVAMRSGKINDVSKYLNTRDRVLRNTRNIYPPLEKAIQRGIRNFKLKGAHIFNEEDLIKIEEISKTRFKQDIAVYLGISICSLYNYIKRYPVLAEAIRKGESSKEEDFFKKYKGKKQIKDELAVKQKSLICTVTKTPKKPKKSQCELIAKVDIEDTEEALARYRRTKEKERMEMMQRKVRDKEEFNNMIGA